METGCEEGINTHDIFIAQFCFMHTYHQIRQQREPFFVVFELRKTVNQQITWNIFSV